MSYSFEDCKCISKEQFEYSITRLYHTIEKGLSYENYRPGFGAANIEALLTSLEQFVAKGYNVNSFTYETALSCLYQYIYKNKEYGIIDNELEKRINKLPGEKNDLGGSIEVSSPLNPSKLPFRDVLLSRHSIRHFSNEPVDMSKLESAIKLAQHTPSACNRQGWKTRVVSDKCLMQSVLLNQNGNKGFGNEFNKLLVVTADLRAQQKNREVFQAFIDGGMYAQNLLNALYTEGIGSVPLSASLTLYQDHNIRKLLEISDAEIFILFIGIGNYPDGVFLTTKSERKPSEIARVYE